MRGALRQDGLHIIGRDIVAALHQRLCFGRTQQRNGRAGRQALHKPATIAAGSDQVLHIVNQRISRVHLQDLLLQCVQAVGIKHGGEVLGRIALAVACQQGVLGRAVGVAQRQAHEKAVELRLGQGVSANLVERVLCGDDEKWLGQRPRRAFYRDLFFFHGFEQSGLRFGAGAVDLVSQQHLRKQGAGVKDKLARVALKHRDAAQIAGH